MQSPGNGSELRLAGVKTNENTYICGCFFEGNYPLLVGLSRASKGQPIRHYFSLGGSPTKRHAYIPRWDYTMSR